MNELILVGAGDFCLEICSYVNDINSHLPDDRQLRIAALHDNPSKARLTDISRILKYTPRTIEDMDECLSLKDAHWVIAIGNPVARSKVLNRLEKKRVRLKSIVHPKAYVSESAIIGDGVILAPFAFIGPQAVLEKNVAVNVSAVIGHDAVIGHSSVISPLANMNGHAMVGPRCFLGAGSTMNPNISMGADSKLTASSVLSGSVTEGFLMHGNPAKGRKMFKAPTDIQE